MPTIEKRVSQAADDGRLYWDGSGWNYQPGDPDHKAGYQDASHWKFCAWQLFRNITIPQGATILAAKLTYVCNYKREGTVVRTKIAAADQDNPSPPSSANDYLARPLTSAVINWDGIPIWSVGQVVDSPELKDIIQELVNRDNWQSGNTMLLFWDDRDDRSDHGYMTLRSTYSYDGSTTKAPLLTIEYSIAPPAPEIETQDATSIKSDEAMIHTKVIDDKGKTLSVRHNWGKTTAYGENTPWQEGKHTNDVISQKIIDLDPETEYHFRGEAVYED